MFLLGMLSAYTGGGWVQRGRKSNYFVLIGRIPINFDSAVFVEPSLIARFRRIVGHPGIGTSYTNPTETSLLPQIFSSC